MSSNMVTVAGIQVPSDVYQSMLNVVNAEKQIAQSSPVFAFLCNPLVQLGPNGTFPLCLSAAVAVEQAAEKVQSVLQQAYNQILQAEQQAKANGQTISSVPIKIYVPNVLALFIKSTCSIIPNPISNAVCSWESQQITNLELSILQAGVQQFNSDTLQKVNNYLSQQGWQLQPVSISYDSSSDQFILSATYVETGSPLWPIWAILVLVAIVVIGAIIALYIVWQIVVINDQTKQKQIQYQQVVAQQSSSVFQNCVQVANNVAQCNQVLSTYLNGLQQLANTLGGGQPPYQATLQTIEDIAIIAVIAGLAVVILTNMKK